MHNRSASSAVALIGGTVEQSRYIVASCIGCHGANLAGAKLHGAPPGTPLSPNLNPAGRLARWTQAEFIVALRTGARRDGSTMNDMMPWKAFSHLSDDELQAVFAYLRTVPSAPSPGK